KRYATGRTGPTPSRWPTTSARPWPPRLPVSRHQPAPRAKSYGPAAVGARFAGLTRRGPTVSSWQRKPAGPLHHRGISRVCAWRLTGGVGAAGSSPVPLGSRRSADRLGRSSWLSARLGWLSARLGRVSARSGWLSAGLGWLSARLGWLSARLGW